MASSPPSLPTRIHGRGSPPASSTVAAVLLGLLALTGSAAPAGAQGAYAFVDVNVVPMTRYGVLEDRVVLVRDGTIRTVGPADSVEIPVDAAVIRGRGGYLLPGLAEMHAHVPGPDTPREVVEDLLFLYVANGVTVIRGMQGAPGQVSLKLAALRNEIVSPIMYLASPAITGQAAPEPDLVEALVEAYASRGWDLLKVHEGLTREVWDRLVETAIERGVSYGGHVSDSVGLRYAFATGISTVDHLDGFLQEAVSDYLQARLEAGEEMPLDTLLAGVDPQEIRAIAGRTRAASTYVVPTLYLWENFSRRLDPDSMIALPEMRYVPRRMREAWVRQKTGMGAEPWWVADRLAEVRKEIVKALNDAGADLLMGTDSPQMFNVPGFSLYRELPLMSEAGLTPYEVLLTGTRNVADYASRELGEAGNFGAVAAGNRADLVLVEENPLEDLGALEGRVGVMLRGRWLPASTIENRLERIAQKYRR
ncbi:MAG: amidohydrolase family protein [Gemmatimonadetes bacterium]|nr:amidohydrolase family protein [Gemmatimonadota bacterium]NIR78285.1 amidohydrolase family protein [Gemmatimonadota bacterium]NIT86869.1 amidohydrolase family protein [Gemmatimonadota bacterium]NIU30738.1 amidohydrolase family protein [Gemmatimonadota bacterium]NIV61097.1 amidohydrolase family protein [Gemmatimonadota bacterium]